MRFGAHMSTRGGPAKAIERAQSIASEICQIFVKNNMQWLGKPFAAPDLASYREQVAQAKLHCIFGHAGYLINLAAPASANRDKSIQSLIQEIELATSLELPFLVLHPGAHVGTGESEGLTQIVHGLNEAFQGTRTSRVRIALENTAGQGSCLGCQVRDLATIYERVDAPARLGICLDTAHFFAAGYDIRSPKGWDSAIGEVEMSVGLKEILAFHLNDSKTDLGSRVDRHAHIGQGKIGREAFRYIVNDARFADRPGCLETPKSDDLHEDLENLRVLRSLCGEAKAAKGAVGASSVKRRPPAAAKRTQGRVRSKPKQSRRGKQRL